ncbi:MAG: transposase [Microvirga sp.]|jgi:hypothetical protein|nr:transposase [Microvirga sp.]MDF2971821.1 transposase [Microvirga sp.]
MGEYHSRRQSPPRRVLVEAAWSYRHPARVSETLRARLERLPKPVRDIAWKAQIRLCARYRRLSAAANEELLKPRKVWAQGIRVCHFGTTMRLGLRRQLI